MKAISDVLCRSRGYRALLVACLFATALAHAQPPQQAAASQSADLAPSQQPVGEPKSHAAFAAALAELPTTRLSKLPQLVVRIADSGGEAALPYLSALVENDLHVRQRDQSLFRMTSSRAQSAIDLATGERVQVAADDRYKKVIVNNLTRSRLRGLIAQLQLSSDDAAKREHAARALLSDPSAANRALLAEALTHEERVSVRAVLEAGIAVADLTSDDADLRLAALDQLKGSLEASVRARVAALVAEDPDPAVRKQAQRTLTSIESRRSLYALLETLFFGLSLGSVLLLAAIGLAITFGVMGVINMAHGELIMIGAYTTFVIQQWMPNQIDYSLWVAIPAAFLVSGLVGVAIERGVIRWLYGRPLETLLATFGLSLVLQQAVRTLFSPLNRSVETPSWMSGSLQINPVFSLTYNRLYIIGFGLIVFFLLLLLLKKTWLGLYVRAVSQNRGMARAMGVRSDWVDALTFGLGSGVAGIAGVALSQLTNVGPNMGQAYIIDSFMVVVFGGVGNLWGTLVASMSLGVANKFLEPASGAVLAKIAVLIFIILFIQKRPRGLFPQQGRSAES